MEITAGNCRVRQAGEEQWKTTRRHILYGARKSFFEISAEEDILEYICSFE